MSQYFFQGGHGMYLVVAFAGVSLVASGVQLFGAKWELRGLVWTALGLVPVMGVLMTSLGLSQLIEAMGNIAPDLVAVLLAAGVAAALYPLHLALVCALVLIPVAAVAVTRRRGRVR